MWLQQKGVHTEEWGHLLSTPPPVCDRWVALCVSRIRRAPVHLVAALSAGVSKEVEKAQGIHAGHTVYVSLYTYIYIYIYTYIHIYIPKYIRTHIHFYAYMSRCMCIYAYTLLLFYTITRVFQLYPEV